MKEPYLKTLSLNDLASIFPFNPVCKITIKASLDEDIQRFCRAVKDKPWSEISYKIADEFAQELAVLPMSACNYYLPGFLLMGLYQCANHGDVTILFYLRECYNVQAEHGHESRQQTRLDMLTDKQKSVVRKLVNAPFDSEPKGQW